MLGVVNGFVKVVTVDGYLKGLVLLFSCILFHWWLRFGKVSELPIQGGCCLISVLRCKGWLWPKIGDWILSKYRFPCFLSRGQSTICVNAICNPLTMGNRQDSCPTISCPRIYDGQLKCPNVLLEKVPSTTDNRKSAIFWLTTCTDKTKIGSIKTATPPTTLGSTPTVSRLQTRMDCKVAVGC